MRLLHTADWHLGQTFFQFDRGYEHQRFLNWLLDLLVEESVDGLLIAGDVFDNANPSASAQAQFYQFVAAARQRIPHLNLVVIAGNHDSPGRLEAPSPFLEAMGGHVVGAVRGQGSDVNLDRLVVPLKNVAGGIEAWCVAMPYLRPADVPRVEEATDYYAAGFTEIHKQALAYALTKKQSSQALIGMGHCHLSGGQVSEDSERRIVIGGAETMSASVFGAEFAYVGLGHLHCPQIIDEDPTRRYSGSPLPMSFSEIGYPHQVVLVDVVEGGVENIRPVRVPRVVDLLRVPEQPQPLSGVLEKLRAIEISTGPESEWPYLQVRVQLDQPEPHLRSRVEEALNGKPVRLARIETSYASKGEKDTTPAVSLDELATLSPGDFFRRLYQQQYQTEVPEPLAKAFDEILLGLPEEGRS